MSEEQWNSVVETNSLLNGNTIFREAYNLPITVERAMYPGKKGLRNVKHMESQAKHKQPFDSNLAPFSTLLKTVPTQTSPTRGLGRRGVKEQ
jgi:hypothetical protein